MSNDILARNLLLLRALKDAKEKLPKEEKIILLKGAALLELGLADPFTREMTDVDILIDKQTLPKLQNALKEEGFFQMPKSSAWIKPALNSPPLIIDPHINLRHIKKNMPKPETIEIKDGFHSLCPEDMFIHICAHSLLHHGFLFEKAQEDLVCIFKKNPDKQLLPEKIIKKAENYRITLLIDLCIEKTFKAKRFQGLGIFNKNYSFKEKIFYFLIISCFKRELFLNEYIFEFIYSPKSFFKRILKKSGL